jgi:hypothetical protein
VPPKGLEHVFQRTRDMLDPEQPQNVQQVTLAFMRNLPVLPPSVQADFLGSNLPVLALKVLRRSKGRPSWQTWRTS